MLLFIFGSGGYPPIYISIVSHNEEPSTGQYPDFTADPDTFWVHREAVRRFAEMLHGLGVSFNYQSEWNFLLATVMYDTGTVTTNGKNIIKYLVEDLGVEVDPHAHETIYNYADVAYLIDTLIGGEPSHTVGGYIAYPPDEAIIEYFWDTIWGWNYSYAWKAEILWGGSTRWHVNEDSLYISGVWKPMDNAHYLLHSDDAPLPEVGGYNRRLDGLHELLVKQENGELKPWRMYTATIFLEQNQMLDSSYVEFLRSEIESLLVLQDSGRVNFVTLKEAVDIWRNVYNSRPNMYSYVAGDITNPYRDTLWLVMDDGVMLEATIFRPVDPVPPGGFPGIIFVHGLGGSKRQMEPRAEFFAREGYVTLAYSVRGQGLSQGLSTLFSWREREDLENIINWLKSLPDVNDTLIGVSGASQGGFHSWHAGVFNMGVRAVAPENSVPLVSQAMARYGCYSSCITSGMDWTPSVRVDTINYPIKHLLLEDNYDSIVALIRDGREFDSVDVMNSSCHYLMMGAWHDHIFWHNRMPGAFSVAPLPSYMYLGTGGHGSEMSPGEQTFRNYLRKIYFDAFLKGDYSSLDTVSPVTVALGPNWEHLNFDVWPPPLSYVSFYLKSDGTLSMDPPTASDTSVWVVNQLLDPLYTWEYAVNDHFEHVTNSFLEDRFSFRTDPLPDTVIILGIPSASVYARGTGSRFQVNLQLYAESPAGELTYLSNLSMGVRQNEDTTEWHNLEGEFTIVGWKVPPGYRLRIDLASINLSIGSDTFLWTVPYWADGRVYIAMDPTHPSSVTLPFLGEVKITENEKYLKERLLLYPNPAEGEVTLDLPLLKAKVSIYTVSGRRILSRSIDKFPLQLKLADEMGYRLKSGVYLIRVESGGKIWTGKLTVFH